jgi:hypothetical protein
MSSAVVPLLPASSLADCASENAFVASSVVVVLRRA